MVDDGPWLYYKLTNEPKGSGELIINDGVEASTMKSQARFQIISLMLGRTSHESNNMKTYLRCLCRGLNTINLLFLHTQQVFPRFSPLLDISIFHEGCKTTSCMTSGRRKW